MGHSSPRRGASDNEEIVGFYFPCNSKPRDAIESRHSFSPYVLLHVLEKKKKSLKHKSGGGFAI